MECKVSDVYRVLDEIAPFATQMDFDNAGLLLGHPENRVDCIYGAGRDERRCGRGTRAGAQLIVTHHPVVFPAVKRLVETNRKRATFAR